MKSVQWQAVVMDSELVESQKTKGSASGYGIKVDLCDQRCPSGLGPRAVIICHLYQ